MATDSNTESCQIAPEVNHSGSLVEGTIFPHKIAQEVLIKILWYLNLAEYRSMALSCKNLYEELITALYNSYTHGRRLTYAARRGRVENL